MIARCRTFRHFFLFCLAAQGLLATLLRAQAPIDPSLPPAPLPHASFFSLFPGYEVVSDPTRPVPPLSPRQKLQIAWNKTVAPALPIDSLFVAGFDQATNLGPAYGQEWGAFGKRVGYNAANFTSKSLLAFGVVPMAFHQDPRYFRMGTGSVGRRVRGVFESQVIAFSDRGKRMPNCGKLIGYAASTAISNLYMPRKSVSFGNDVKGYGIKFAVSISVDTIREFDLTRFIRKLNPVRKR
ncbi:MAG TPA: hypothetical protein VGG45_14295 [Terracidiphilus sp.]|jgi:hypothetical protein